VENLRFRQEFSTLRPKPKPKKKKKNTKTQKRIISFVPLFSFVSPICDALN
jgi:hypothetical protein